MLYINLSMAPYYMDKYLYETSTSRVLEIGRIRPKLCKIGRIRPILSCKNSRNSAYLGRIPPIVHVRSHTVQRKTASPIFLTFTALDPTFVCLRTNLTCAQCAGTESKWRNIWMPGRARGMPSLVPFPVASGFFIPRNGRLAVSH